MEMKDRVYVVGEFIFLKKCREGIQVYLAN